MSKITSVVLSLATLLPLTLPVDAATNYDNLSAHQITMQPELMLAQRSRGVRRRSVRRYPRQRVCRYRPERVCRYDRGRRVCRYVTRRVCSYVRR